MCRFVTDDLNVEPAISSLRVPAALSSPLATVGTRPGPCGDGLYPRTSRFAIMSRLLRRPRSGRADCKSDDPRQRQPRWRRKIPAIHLRWLAGMPIFLAACGPLAPFIDRYEVAADLAATHGWTPGFVKTSNFTLARFSKGLEADGDTLAIYIEGDGLAWISRRRQSSDPTPTNPVALRLATRDSSAKVAYLGRPCQFSQEEMDRACVPAYWGSHRYSEAVIRAIDQAIEKTKQEAKAKILNLFGYSGGGAVAVLVAARRSDVASIVTVAANLDHVRWTAMHEVSPLTGSLNPADYAPQVQHIRQIHLIGQDDTLVPQEVARAYIARMTDERETTIVVLPDFDHHCCWVKAWPELIERYELASENSRHSSARE